MSENTKAKENGGAIELAPTITEQEAISIMGTTRWQAMSPEQRSRALQIRLTEIESADVSKVFGKESDSALANQIAKDSPVRYRLLKNRAMKEGLV